MGKVEQLSTDRGVQFLFDIVREIQTDLDRLLRVSIVVVAVCVNL